MNIFTSIKNDLKSEVDDSFVYILPGNPVPLSRPRHGNGVTWNPQKQTLVCARITLEQQHNDRPMFCGPIQFNVAFYLPIAPSKSQKKKNALFGTFHSTIPDLSNLLKFVEDAGKGVLYKDDCIISSAIAEKTYSNEPRTELTILELT